MKKLSFIFIFLIGLFGHVRAQDSTIHPYVGESVNFYGVSDRGWGIELGFRYNNFILVLNTVIMV
jgi:hypothetical protein